MMHTRSKTPAIRLEPGRSPAKRTHSDRTEPLPVVQRKCACGGGCSDCEEKQTLQPKLAVGPANDRYEQEADRVAEQVTRMQPAHLQRKPVEEEDDEEVVRTKPAITSLQHPQAASPTDIDAGAVTSGGSSLSSDVRQFHETRFGRDFSDVRIHTDDGASRTAESLKARAFTSGKHISFASGQFAPGTAEGDRLLAHELTHVVQQSGGDLIQRAPDETEMESEEGEEGSPMLDPEIWGPSDPDIPPFPWELNLLEDLDNATSMMLYQTLVGAWNWMGTDISTTLRLMDSVRQSAEDMRPLIDCVSTGKEDSGLPHLDRLKFEVAEASRYLAEPSEEYGTRYADPYVRSLFETAGSAVEDLDPYLAGLEDTGSVGSCAAVMLIPFAEGLITGLRSISPEEADRFQNRLATNAAFSAMFPSFFITGTAVGIVKDAKKLIEDAIALVSDPSGAAQKFIDAMQQFGELVNELASPTGADVARDIGAAAGYQFAETITELNRKEGSIEFAFALGEKIGPVIVYTILSLLGFEAIVAGRVLLLAQQSFRRLKSFTRLVRLLKRMPDVDVPDVKVPIRVSPEQWKAFLRWESRLNEETRILLEADPELRRVFAEMDPAVRKVLTKCDSFCIPPTATAADALRIAEIIKKPWLVPKDHRGLREYFHHPKRRDNLPAAIDSIDAAKNLPDLERILDDAIKAGVAKGASASRLPDSRWRYVKPDGRSVDEYSIATHKLLTSDRYRTSSFFQSHHGIQDQWGIRKGIPGYDRDDCPAILLRDSHLASPHQTITAIQVGEDASLARRTYAEMREALRAQLKEGLVPEKQIQDLLGCSDAYFCKLYRGSAGKLTGAEMRDIWGTWVPSEVCPPLCLTV